MERITRIMIAPCGMNCAICKAHLREKNRCDGCRAKSKEKSNYCGRCLINNCIIIKKNKWKFCSTKCEKFPCKRLKQLDKRYRTKYCMSMIENLKNIEKSGIKKFIENEKKRWIKKDKIFCVHDKKYY